MACYVYGMSIALIEARMLVLGGVAMENDLNISYSEIKFLERKRALLGGGLNSPPPPPTHTHTHTYSAPYMNCLSS